MSDDVEVNEVLECIPSIISPLAITSPSPFLSVDGIVVSCHLIAAWSGGRDLRFRSSDMKCAIEAKQEANDWLIRLSVPLWEADHGFLQRDTHNLPALALYVPRLRALPQVSICMWLDGNNRSQGDVNQSATTINSYSVEEIRRSNRIEFLQHCLYERLTPLGDWSRL